MTREEVIRLLEIAGYTYDSTRLCFCSHHAYEESISDGTLHGLTLDDFARVILEQQRCAIEQIAADFKSRIEAFIAEKRSLESRADNQS